MSLRVVALGLVLLACDRERSCEDAACARVAVECRSSEDCADELACNGDEVCEGNRCVSGTPVECADGLSCVDGDDGASCEFPSASPWFIYIGNDLGADPLRLFGIRQADMGHATPLDLTANVATEEYAGPTFRGWSPDGRILVFDLAYPTFESRMLYVRFGKGLPSPALPVPDLPVSDEWEPTVDWSAGGKSAVMRHDDGRYFLDFREEPPRTTLLEYEGARVSWATPCADGGSVVFGIADDPRTFVGTTPTLEDAQPLPEDTWIAAGCGVNGPRRFPDTGVPPDEGDWSPDLRFFVFSSPSEDGEASEITVFDAEGDGPPWRASGSASWYWSAYADAELVFQTGPDLTFAVARFPGGEIQDLGLPADAGSVFRHASGTTFVAYDEATENASSWVRLDGWSDAVPLVGCEGDANIRYDDGPSQAACKEELDSGWNLFTFTFEEDGSVSRNRPLTTPTEELWLQGFSPDGRGVIGQRDTYGNEWHAKIFWIEAPFVDDAPVVDLNPGTLAYDGEWQPTPSAQR
jgi:hypothetical protein